MRYSLSPSIARRPITRRRLTAAERRRLRQQEGDELQRGYGPWCTCHHHKLDHSQITGRCDLCSCQAFVHDEVEI
jgi:hypothetical protein